MKPSAPPSAMPSYWVRLGQRPVASTTMKPTAKTADRSRRATTTSSERGAGEPSATIRSRLPLPRAAPITVPKRNANLRSRHAGVGHIASLGHHLVAARAVFGEEVEALGDVAGRGIRMRDRRSRPERGDVARQRGELLARELHAPPPRLNVRVAERHEACREVEVGRLCAHAHERRPLALDVSRAPRAPGLGNTAAGDAMARRTVARVG